MIKQIILFALITISFFEAYSQEVFKKGYFINNSNQKIECLIKNIEFVNTPTKFKYKLSQNGTIQKATIQNVKEFGIYNVYKYIRAKTNIDKSSDKIDQLSSDVKPDFHQELLFLKVLIEGQASLYLYNDNNSRFFYKLNDSEIKQLVYKRYLVNDIIHENNYFKQQLYSKLKCEKLTSSDFESLRYNKKDLVRLFIKYNECKKSNYINYKPKQKKGKYNFTIRAGMNFSTFRLNYGGAAMPGNQNFWNPKKIQLGIEGEYILPYYNVYKWSFIVEPTFQSYKYSFSKPFEQEIENNSVIYIPFPYNIKEIYVSKIIYNSIQLPLGVRRYFHINNNSKIFFNTFFVFNNPFNSTIEFTWRDYFNHYSFQKVAVKSSINYALGVGYKFKNLLNIEIRYFSKNYLGDTDPLWQINHRTISLIAGISIL